MSENVRAMVGSFFRVFTAAVIAAYLELGKAPLDLELADARVLANAGIAALILTAYNYMRPGETRFGRGSEDIGMGGDDTLKPPDGQVQTPDGPVSLLPPVGSRADRVRRVKASKTDRSEAWRRAFKGDG